jgi:hypothetical protein
MESFGNAGTVRNCNSSRLGKYIEIKFASSSSLFLSPSSVVPVPTLVGASIETYLLEEVPLVHQSLGERNYHIFYEVLSQKYDNDGDDDDNQEEEEDGGSSMMLEKLGLRKYNMEEFSLMNTSDTYNRQMACLMHKRSAK